MSTVRSNSTLVFFFIFFLFVTPSQSLSFSSYLRYRNLFSLSHSLLTAVANLRASRGDVAAADRARAMADSIDKMSGIGFLRFLWSAWSWSWKDLSLTDLYGAVSDINELLRSLNEFTRLESPAQTSAWLSRNYQKLLKVTKSLSRKLLNSFGQSKVVREIVETLQKEVVEGGLIRDCLQVGTKDLKALVQVLKDLILQFSPATDKDPDL
ncbi:uncharacterized protein LOC130722178 [Lotus japonicus]|uniref:uncharacterized protein LOC130722178 n=1 Tax=Lotus japonicus TaxID=34305 RepID=UPI00258E32EB|nr:uncharacterized protein LOC130722178 [Lotus japonicus]